MKKGVLLIVTALLTACSQAESASESPVTDRVSETSITSSAETAKPAETTEPAKETFITIDAEIVSYKNGELTFLYGGESYTLPMEREQFKENEVPFKHSKLISEQIIGSRPGEKVPAAITVNEDMTRIRLCDVIRLNGKVFDSDKYSLHRTEGSKIELTGSGGSIEADLNDLPYYLKLDYPEDIPRVSVRGYMFSDGSFLLHDLMTEYSAEEDVYVRQWDSLPKLPGFFATVQSVEGGLAAVLLGDGKTVCTAPTFYSDGELLEGMEIMIVLDADTSLWNSGAQQEFDYAVIYTDPEIYLQTSHSFDEIAYSLPASSVGEFVYTLKEIISR